MLRTITIDYYEEMALSTTERFTQQFTVFTEELDGILAHIDAENQLLSDDRLEKRQGLLDLIGYSNFVDYGLIINEDKLIVASVFRGTISPNDIDTDGFNSVEQASLGQAQMIKKANLLEYIIPLDKTGDQIHLFIDLDNNSMLQSFFQSISFTDNYFLTILDDEGQSVFRYNTLEEADLSTTLEPLFDQINNPSLNGYSAHLLDNHSKAFMIAHQRIEITGWHLLLVVPGRLSDQFMRELFQLILPILAGLAIALFLLISYIAYRNQRPYQALLAAIQAVNAGDYQHRIDAVNLNQRIGSINQQFNAMVQQLEQYRYEVIVKEQSLKNQKSFLDRIINTSPILIYTMTYDGRYTMANDSYAAVYGLTPTEIVGKNLTEIDAIKHRAKTDLSMNQDVLASGITKRYEDAQLNSDGVVHWYQVIKQPFLGLNGRETETLMIATDITTIHNQQKIIEHQAFHDDLTEIGNRKLFKQNIKEAIEAADQENTSFAVLFLDLDRFKYVNDTLGHDAGDQLLIEVASRIKATIGKNDSVFRFGGDEFTILAYFDENRREINALANQLIRALTKPYMFDHQAFIVTASIGISLYPKHAQTIDELTKFADLSMYQAKQQGKNTYRIYTKELQTENSKVIRLETDLYQADARDEIFVKYQPIFSESSRNIIAVEAFMRWEHSKLGIIAPQAFIPIAESNGLIHSMGLKVIKEAVMTVARYNQTHEQPINLHINLGEVQLLNVLTLERIKRVLETYQFAPMHVVIEVEEDIVMKTKSPVPKVLHMYQTAGFQIAIDNFGENYLPFKTLKRFPIDFVKVSQTALIDLVESNDDQEDFNRMMTYLKQLDINVIQEGIETEEQARYLETYQLYGRQGFLFSQPLTKEYFEQLY